MSEELKPCPFCGSKAEYTSDVSFDGEIAIVCPTCGVKMQEHYFENSATTLWNMRPDDPLLTDLRKLAGEWRTTIDINPYTGQYGEALEDCTDELESLIQKHGGEG